MIFIAKCGTKMRACMRRRQNGRQKAFCTGIKKARLPKCRAKFFVEN